MKKFMFAAALSCFGNMVLLDTNVFGMRYSAHEDMSVQEDIGIYNQLITQAKDSFEKNDVENLWELLCRADDVFESIKADYRQKIIGNQHTGWLSLIQQRINDSRYVNALNILLIFATKWNSMDTIRLILTNPQTSCDTLVEWIADTTAIHEVPFSENAVQVLDYFFLTRPESKFNIVDKFGQTLLNVAISYDNVEVVQWLLDLYQAHGTDIGQYHENCQIGGSVLGQALEDSMDDEMFFSLMNYKGRDGRYLFSADWPCYGAYSNVLIRFIMADYCTMDNIDYECDESIYSLLLSERIDSLLDVFRFNQVVLPSDKMTNLFNRISALRTATEQALRGEFDAVEKERLRNVLSAVDIYTFWNNIENGDLNTALELLNSGRVCLSTVCDIIASNNLNLSIQLFANLYNMATATQNPLLCHAVSGVLLSERMDSFLDVFKLNQTFLLQDKIPQLPNCIISWRTAAEQALQGELDAIKKERLQNVLSSINIYIFWQRIENSDFNGARELLNSECVDLKTVCDITASNNLTLSSKFFENLYNFGISIEHQPLCQALNICSFRKALETGNLDNMLLLLREKWIDLSDVINILDSGEFVLSNEIYEALVQIASNNVQYGQDITRAIVQLDARVFERAIDSSDWPLMLYLFCYNRVSMISFNKWDELVLWLQKLNYYEISIEERDELLGYLQCLQPTMQQQNFDMQIQNALREGINILNRCRLTVETRPSNT